ncbi:MAG: hemolysin family protein [Anaerolineae bacterium]|nr:hemolysin family protein [Thermoflexales bacterium]MDW8396275.1 hemolysin family protein [Anaerolineae bacterium]
MELVLGVGSLFVLVLVNAFFVFAEYSLAVSRRTRILELAESGDARAQIVARVMEDPDRFFAATQVGVTLASLAIGAIGEPAFGALIERVAVLAGVPTIQPLASALPILSPVLALVIASYFQIVLAELTPRAITLRMAEQIALIVVPPMNALASLLRPFVWLLRSSSRLILRAIGIQSSLDNARLHTLEELKMLVEASEKGGVIEPTQSDMVSAVFSLGDITVREVMVPRTAMVCASADASLSQVAHLFATHAYSRIPVYDGSLDHIIGVLHVKDLIHALLSETRKPELKDLLREPFFVPDTQRADELLQQLRERREYMAIVLDEYGGTAGLVTLNDLVGRIVGEMQDLNAPTPPSIQPTDDGALINGLATIGDVNDAFNLKLTDPHYDTIGGYVMGKLGRIPKVGDRVEDKAHGVVFVVEEMDRLRVAKVRLRRMSDTL